jgi:hypothetical protein
LKFRVLFIFTLFSASLAADSSAPVSPDMIVDHFLAATRGQEKVAKGASMEVDMSASLPKLKKEGRLHALRRISSLGRITYEMLKFDGDSTVKRQVIARYMEAEVEAQKDPSPAMAITPQNYKFRYKALMEQGGNIVHIFEVTPRKKRQGLFKGDLWIDGKTFLRIQESGYLVKTPSVFLKKIAFVRKYVIYDGIAVPRQVQSVVDTRLVGKAELTIDFSNYSLDRSHIAAGGAEIQ